ncbi:MAG TPA: hypothetical protein VJ596_02925 [Gemmatimonadaceae bacterium]|nr:hypothetical protein [Gemmatimonadaceae bacterium]
MQRYSLAVLPLALVIAASACNRDRTEAADTTASTGTVAPAPTTPAANIRVTEIDLGRTVRGDTAVVEETDDFRTTDRAIHAIIKHEGAATNASLVTRWTFQDGQTVHEETKTISPTGTRTEYTHAMIQKPDGWPKGKYTLHVLVNGTEVQTAEFEVQ